MIMKHILHLASNLDLISEMLFAIDPEDQASPGLEAGVPLETKNKEENLLEGVAAVVVEQEGLAVEIEEFDVGESVQNVGDALAGVACRAGRVSL